MAVIGAFLCSLFAGLIAVVFLVRFCKTSMAAFHRAFTNPVASRFAARVPGFAIVVHVGRKSGRLCRTPANLFWWGDGVLIALRMAVKVDGSRMYWRPDAANF
jgi:hypothetical protein